jgi:gliding motility-associated-like protein
MLGRRVFLLFFLMFAWTIRAQQNLVYNGDFELYSSCPTTVSSPGSYEIQKCLGWTNATYATPDYYNVCNNSINNVVGIPTNSLGQQNSYDGNGYCGFLAFEYSQIFWFEYIQGNLSQVLTAGNKYKMEFYVSRAEYSNVNLSRIGAYFTNNNFFLNDSAPLSGSPQILNNVINYVSDTLNWVKISGEFIASGGEKYVTIGFFSDTTAMDTVTAIGSPYIDHPVSYYYIDGISLKDVTDTSCENKLLDNVPNVITPNGDNVNDEWKLNDTCFSLNDLVIYNRRGLKIFETKKLGEGWGGYTTSGLPCTEGTYYFIINYSSFTNKEYTKSGYIQLISQETIYKQ